MKKISTGGRKALQRDNNYGRGKIWGLYIRKCREAKALEKRQQRHILYIKARIDEYRGMVIRHPVDMADRMQNKAVKAAIAAYKDVLGMLEGEDGVQCRGKGAGRQQGRGKKRTR